LDIKTKEILAFLEVTDEKVHDGRKIMPKLIEHVLENNKDVKIESALGDGSYDSNENFKYLQMKRIRPPAIKVRKNSIISSKKKKTKMHGIEKSSFKQKRYSQLEEEKKLRKTMDC
jgi:hypothetical protein